MTTKKVTRHYCDHCRKGSFTKPSMVKHESRCCRNPNRACGVCEKDSTNVEANAKLLMAEGLDTLKSKTDCPACILAAHMMANKLSGFTTPGRWADEDTEFYYYDYKEAMKQWFSEKNNMAANLGHDY